MKKALITGITGQDGAYLAKHLISCGYEVYGGYRRLSSENFWRLRYLEIFEHKQLILTELDITDMANCFAVISKIEPDEIYNLAAQSFVGVSFEQPVTTSMISGFGSLNLLEVIKNTNRKIKFYQASTSEMFGLVQTIPQDENTPFYPRSPYGVAKLYAHWMTKNYREAYSIFASNGILFNHESPLRGLEFVSRKITDAVAKIYLGKIDCFEVGNLDAKRDWGYAEDYVKGMHSMLQHDVPDDFVLATGKTYTVRDFIILSFQFLGITIEFAGKGENEYGIRRDTNEVVVRINKKFFRPSEVELLVGNAQKAEINLGWRAKTSLENLCEIMVKADIERHRLKNGS